MIPLRDANPTRRTPWITLVLISACFVVFALELGIQAAEGYDGLARFFETWGAIPADISAAIESRTVLDPAWLGVLTSMFIHAGWIHLLGNMLYLWIFGNNIEDRLGRVLFVAFYLAGGFAAALTQTWVDPTSSVPMVGASGAIAATLGAYLVLFPRHRVLSLVFLGFFYQLIEVPAVLILGFWFILQLIDGVASLGGPTSGGGVAFFAHIGGFVVGLACGFGLRLLRGRGGRAAAWG